MMYNAIPNALDFEPMPHAKKRFGSVNPALMNNLSLAKNPSIDKVLREQNLQ